MTTMEVLQDLKRVGAVTCREGVPTGYMMGMVCPHPVVMFRLCCAVAQQFMYDCVDVVVAIDSEAISQWVAYFLSQTTSRREVLGFNIGDDFFAMSLHKRFINGKKVLVVAEAVTTGDSASFAIESVRSLGGEVVGLGVLCNCRGLAPQAITVPKIGALITLNS